MNEHTPKFAGAVLGGGRSTRMGEDKGLLELQGESLGARGIKKLERAGCGPLTYVGKPFPTDLPNGVQLLPDDEPEKGPLMALRTILRHSDRPVVIMAVDLCCAPISLIQALMDQWRDGNTALCAESGDLRQPLCGIYSPELAEPAWNRLQNGDGSMFGLLQAQKGRWLNWREEKDLRNVNTPPEWDELKLDPPV